MSELLGQRVATVTFAERRVLFAVDALGFLAQLSDFFFELRLGIFMRP
jgi:hypothetical protein